MLSNKFPLSAREPIQRSRFTLNEQTTRKRVEKKTSWPVSPVKVDHWSDDQTRKSCDSEFSTTLSSEGRDEFQNSQQAAHKRSNRLTLKELFQFGGSRKQNSRGTTRRLSTFQDMPVKSCARIKVDEPPSRALAAASPLHPPNSYTSRYPRGTEPPPAYSFHRYRKQKELQAEQMTRRTFLPYRESLLACLGCGRKPWRKGVSSGVV
eukprot:c22823_g1_i1 orf=97-717(-)